MYTEHLSIVVGLLLEDIHPLATLHKNLLTLWAIFKLYSLLQPP